MVNLERKKNILCDHIISDSSKLLGLLEMTVMNKLYNWATQRLLEEKSFYFFNSLKMNGMKKILLDS